MAGFHFSLRSALAAVAYFAVVAAALTDGSPHWFAIVALVAVFAMLVSLVGVIYRKDEHRSFWVGFAIFGWAYLILSHGPGSLPEAMPTGIFFRELFPFVRRAVPLDPLKPHPAWVRFTESENGRPVALIAPKADFIQLGHAICALVSAFLGGAIGRWFFLTRARDRSSAENDQPPSR